MPGIVGFIGLGAMGDPMALNLVKRGFSLVVHDIDPVKAERWQTRGATLAASPADVAPSIVRLKEAASGGVVRSSLGTNSRVTARPEGARARRTLVMSF